MCIRDRVSTQSTWGQFTEIMQKAFAYLVVIALALSVSHAAYYQPPKVNNRPIIGVLSQPSDFAIYPATQYNYIAASYFKWVEAAGARAVPILYDTPRDELVKLLSQINGVIFPGGGADLWINGTATPLSETGEFIVRYAIQANANGTYYPIWGTCLGYELISSVLGGSELILSHYDSPNHVLNITFTSKALESRILRYIPTPLLEDMTTKSLDFFNHHFGITKETFANNEALNQLFDVLALSYDNEGKEFVSIIEAKGLPIYGVQFHPEKVIFEWRLDVHIDHEFEAVQVSQHFANFFIQECRRNINTFSSPEEEAAALIYNYSPIQPPSSFMQLYLFENQQNSTKIYGHPSEGFLGQKDHIYTTSFLRLSNFYAAQINICLLYTSPSPRDQA
eukprot:TRINITY_DN4048_c0_g2_i1.p1 TRINITY_DN4048_c0_g2~~TRINITY_DN4048_c0_g2_i1.p1  ORF type:complete len:394 (-),score=112.03 TRINITY_DN4048_c0_g2_i1:115-1296(-)